MKKKNYISLIKKVFKDLKVERMPKIALIAFVMRELDAHIDGYKEVSRNVGDYISSAVAKGKLTAKSGRNGGIGLAKRK